MDFKRQTEELNNIPIQTVASLLKVTLPRTGSARCPLPDHDDKRPSFEIKSSGTRWVCYGCNRSGGSIDFVKEYCGLTFIGAKRWLVDRAQVNPSSSARFRSSRKAGLTSRPQDEKSRESAPDVEVYECFLDLCPLQTNGLQYLASRAISDKTVAAFRIGQLQDTKVVLATLIKSIGFDRMERSGLLTKKSTRTNPHLVFAEGSLVFPFLENERVAYLQGRAIGPAETRGTWRNLNHRQRRIYNVDALAQNITTDRFAICEGVMDTLSALDLNYIAIGILGVNAKLTADQAKQLRGKEIDILLDWDTAGNKGAVKLQRELNRYGVISTRKSQPSARARDLNEFLMETRGLA
jgi:DNA primase